ncbi:MAG: DUF5368 domain-containing protein [Phreatobacter sp.]
MKDLDPMIFVAVFQEMLGPLLWLLVGLAIAGLVGLLVVLVRDRGVSSGRLVLAELIGLAGGFAALALMWLMTQSAPADIGGPIDWVLVAAIWTVGAIGTAVLAYVAMSLMRRRPLPPAA